MYSTEDGQRSNMSQIYIGIDMTSVPAQCTMYNEITGAIDQLHCPFIYQNYFPFDQYLIEHDSRIPNVEYSKTCTHLPLVHFFQKVRSQVKSVCSNAPVINNAPMTVSVISYHFSTANRNINIKSIENRLISAN